MLGVRKGLFFPLTDALPLSVTLVVGTVAADVVGATLELVALGVGMLRETPTAPQTWAAKARVTREPVGDG